MSGEAERPTAKRALGKMVVGALMSTAARRFRDREAILCAGTGRRFTFRQINERCNRLAHGLAGLGLRKGDVVAFLCNNRAELVEIYFALAKLGLVGIPLNYRLAAAEIVELMRAMGARAMLFETRFTPSAEQARIGAAADQRPSSPSGRIDRIGRSITRRSSPVLRPRSRTSKSRSTIPIIST